MSSPTPAVELDVEQLERVEALNAALALVVRAKDDDFARDVTSLMRVADYICDGVISEEPRR